MPFGWNGSPANFALFWGAISHVRPQPGMGRPGWFATLAFLPELHVDDGLLFDLDVAIRKQSIAPTWEPLPKGGWGPTPSKWGKLGRKESGPRAYHAWFQYRCLTRADRPTRGKGRLRAGSLRPIKREGRAPRNWGSRPGVNPRPQRTSPAIQ